jgi:hypothetical protein
MLEKCIRDFQRATGTQHQRVEAPAQQASRGQKVLGSQAEVSNEILSEAMTIVSGLASTVDAPRIKEYQRLAVIDLLQDI